jgi:NIMA (never in mitosis gene a)-related kinase
MSLSEREKQNALNEIRLLASIKHPNIVQYKESFIDEQSSCLYMVMEYADDGDLTQKINEHCKKGTNFSTS